VKARRRKKRPSWRVAASARRAARAARAQRFSRDRRRLVSRDPAQPYVVSVTYETWNEESLVVGLADLEGFEIDREPMSLRELVDKIADMGSLEMNSGARWTNSRRTQQQITFRTIDEDLDYATGESTMRNLHVESSERAMERLLDVLQSSRLRKSWSIYGLHEHATRSGEGIRPALCTLHEDCRAHRGLARACKKHQDGRDRRRRRAHRVVIKRRA
jgi:hypothetical protein